METLVEMVERGMRECGVPEPRCELRDGVVTVEQTTENNGMKTLCGVQLRVDDAHADMAYPELKQRYIDPAAGVLLWHIRRSLPSR